MIALTSIFEMAIPFTPKFKEAGNDETKKVSLKTQRIRRRTVRA